MFYDNFDFSELKSIRYDIMSNIRGTMRSDEYNLSLICYVLGKCKERDESLKSVLEYLSNKNIGINLDGLTYANVESIDFSTILDKHSNYKDYYASILIEDDISNENSTPASLIELASNILDIENDDNVLDLCSGNGTFLLNAFNKNNNANYNGMEINSSLYDLFRLKRMAMEELSDRRMSTDQLVVKNLNCFDASDKRYDKVFANYPFGLRGYNYMYEEYFNKVEELSGKLPRGISSDWLFNFKIIDLLAETGKALAISTVGSLFVQGDKNARKYFVDNNLIDTIIFLPSKLFGNTAIPTALIVFSKGKDDRNIKVIDATKEFEAGRRVNTLSSKNIERVMKWYTTDESNENVKFVTYDEVVDKDYSIILSDIFEEKRNFKNGVPFGEVTISITRAAQVRADELDKIVSSDPTGYQYFMLNDIQDGLLNNNLPYIKELDPKLEKYCINDGDMILSKNGKPFKVCIVDVGEDTKILANGNFYIIKLDTDKVDPYYIKALFTSEFGQDSLQKIGKGVTIPNISVKDLKEMLIPVPTMKKQREIADTFERNEQEMQVLKLRINKVKENLSACFELSEVECD